MFVLAGWQLTLVDVSAHAVNSVYVICDICVTGVPVRLLHFYQSLIFGAVYAIFSIIYWRAGGRNWEDKDYIYPILDYNDHPTTAAIWWLILFACVAFFHILMYGIYRLRAYLYSRCARARVEPTSPTEVEPSSPTEVEPTSPTEVEPTSPKDVAPADIELAQF